jgi:uncharacterized protein (TIGR03437 family)
MNYIIGLDQTGTTLIFAQSTGQPGSYQQIMAPTPTPLNTWTHVAAELDSGTMLFYINGQLVASMASPGQLAGQGVPFSLGGGLPDGQQVCCTFTGAMRQARVWSRALSSSEIQTYATNVLTGNENGLIADWPLDDGSGQTARDLVPNGATLTLLNGPSWVVPTASSGVPTISSVSNAAGGQPGVFPGSFVSVYGSLFTSLTLYDWDTSITDGQLPTQLDGVSVTIGGHPAYISAVTPGQINAQAPDIANGSMEVVVTTPAGSSAPFTSTAQQYGPAFFLWPNNQPVATHPDYTVAAENGTFPGTTTVPAKPGEVITLWGTGFGPTNPSAPAGQLPGQNAGAPTINPVTVMLNQTSASVLGAALSGFAGIYQVAVQIPTPEANGLGGHPKPAIRGHLKTGQRNS